MSWWSSICRCMGRARGIPLPTAPVSELDRGVIREVDTVGNTVIASITASSGNPEGSLRVRIDSSPPTEQELHTLITNGSVPDGSWPI